MQLATVLPDFFILKEFLVNEFLSTDIFCMLFSRMSIKIKFLSVAFQPPRSHKQNRKKTGNLFEIVLSYVKLVAVLNVCV